MIVIKIKDWEYKCGDGCCYDYGTEVTMNDQVLTTQASNNLEELLKNMMLQLGYTEE